MKFQILILYIKFTIRKRIIKNDESKARVGNRGRWRVNEEENEAEKRPIRLKSRQELWSNCTQWGLQRGLSDHCIVMLRGGKS